MYVFLFHAYLCIDTLQSTMFSRVQQCASLASESEFTFIRFSGMVYQDAETLYTDVMKSGEILIEEALSILFPDSEPFLSMVPPRKFLGGSCDKVIGYNTTFLPRWDIIAFPMDRVNSALKAQILQASDDGKEGYGVMQTPAGSQVGQLRDPNCSLYTHLLPASGMWPMKFATCDYYTKATVYTNGSDHFVLHNFSVRLTISQGRITSLFDVKLRYIF